MKRVHCIAVLLMVLIMPYTSEALHKGEEGPLDPCARCHGLPPLEADGGDTFFSGAHLVHENIDCAKCHNSYNSPDHNDGIINIRSDLNYDHGSKIPYPGGGGGSCGGDRNFSMPNGCHAEQKDVKCFWLPDTECTPISQP